MDDEEDIIRKYQRRRRMYLYGSFLVCLAGGALVAAAMGTQNWVTADVYDKNATVDIETKYYGDFRGGLFQGRSTFVTTQPTSYDYYTVCVEGECMYSCASSMEKREQHLKLVLSDQIEDIENPPCLSSGSKSLKSRNSASRSRKRSISENEDNLVKQPLYVIENYEKTLERFLGMRGESLGAPQEKGAGNEGSAAKLSSEAGKGGGFASNRAARALDSLDSVRGPSFIMSSVNIDPEIEKLTAQGPEGVNHASSDAASADDGEYLPGYAQEALRDTDVRSDKVSEADGLMSEGLWAGTIACLSAGLLFALVGAVFAIVNTATTPVEAITGVTGLYVWNGLAGGFELVAVILWSVMFSSYLSHNVLVEHSAEGWTTEGNEVLGYSFWLVVVSIIIHIGNCGLIAYGTYEPKRKEKIQEPDKATNDILLY